MAIGGVAVSTGGMTGVGNGGTGDESPGTASIPVSYGRILGISAGGCRQRE